MSNNGRRSPKGPARQPAEGKQAVPNTPGLDKKSSEQALAQQLLETLQRRTRFEELFGPGPARSAAEVQGPSKDNQYKPTTESVSTRSAIAPLLQVRPSTLTAPSDRFQALTGPRKSVSPGTSFHQLARDAAEQPQMGNRGKVLGVVRESDLSKKVPISIAAKPTATSGRLRPWSRNRNAGIQNDESLIPTDVLGAINAPTDPTTFPYGKK